MSVVKKKKNNEEVKLTEAQAQFIAKGGAVNESGKKEKKHRVLLEIPDWIFQVMEVSIRTRKRKISRVQWILDAITKKLKIKDE